MNKRIKLILIQKSIHISDLHGKNKGNNPSVSMLMRDHIKYVM